MTPQTICLAIILATSAADDPIRGNLEEAKLAFEQREGDLSKEVLAQLEKRDDAARKAKKIDRRLLDQIKAERRAFVESKEVPTLVSGDLKAKIRDSRAKFAAAFEVASDAYLRAKNDDQAAAVTRELEAFLDRMDKPKDVDLLALIDTTRHGLSGRWIRSGASISSVPGQLDSLLIPYHPPAEYDMTIVAERIGGENDLMVGVHAGRGRCLLVLDGWDSTRSGFSTVDGLNAFNNPSTYHGVVFPDQVSVRVVVAVRKGEITVKANDKVIIKWQGHEDSLFIGGEAWPNQKALWLGAQVNGSFRVTSMVVKPLHGEIGASR